MGTGGVGNGNWRSGKTDEQGMGTGRVGKMGTGQVGMGTGHMERGMRRPHRIGSSVDVMCE